MKKILVCLFVLCLCFVGTTYAERATHKHSKHKHQDQHKHQGQHQREGEGQHQREGGGGINLLRPMEYCAYVDGLSVIVRASQDKDGLHLFYFKDSADQQSLGEEIFLESIKVYDNYIGNNGALGWSGPYYMRFLH